MGIITCSFWSHGVFFWPLKEPQAARSSYQGFEAPLGLPVLLSDISKSLRVSNLGWSLNLLWGCGKLLSILYLQRFPNQDGSRHQLRKSLPISLSQDTHLYKKVKGEMGSKLYWSNEFQYCSYILKLSGLSALFLCCHFYWFGYMTAASRNHRFLYLMSCSWFSFNYELFTEVSGKVLLSLV